MLTALCLWSPAGVVLAQGVPANLLAPTEKPAPQSDHATAKLGVVPALAAPSADVQASGPQATIGAVSVTAPEAFQAGEFSPSYEPFIGRAADAAALSEMARSIAEVARRRGYLFASAVVPAQSLQLGVVKVVIDLGPIDEVRINGSTNPRLRRLLQPLVGRAPLRSEVEHRVLLVQDVPGVSLRNTRYVREGGRGVFIVDVEEDKAALTAGMDNYGSDSQGPYRARLSAELNSLALAGDRFDLDLLNTTAHPRQLRYGGVRYAAPLGAATTAGVSAGVGASRPGGDLKPFELKASTRYYSVFASRVLVRSKPASLSANLEATRLESKESVFSTLIQKDRLTTLSAWLSGDAALAGGRLSGGLGLVRGVGVGPFSHRDDPLSSRPDASGVFTKETAWANWTAPLGRHNSVKLAANGQWTSRPLLASQQIGLGGPGFGRAFDFSERFGDRGVAGLVELRRELPNLAPAIKALQAYGFADGGSVTALQGGFGGGRLFSAGLGLRGRAGPVEFGVEVAAPLNTDRYKSRDRSPRLNLQVNTRI